jgi:nucleotide-binding universal stress UspA family protein
MYRHILVPLDGSELAAHILPQVENLATALKSQITLMTVASLLKVWSATESNSTDTDESYSTITEEFSSRMKKAAEENLAKVAAQMKARGLNVNCVYAVGIPAQTIIDYARKHSVDLIAMATHGIGEVARPLGSVAEKVVSHSSTPVLLMRVLEREPIASEEEITIRPD